MGNIKIIGGSFDTKLELEHAGVAAGFPSPAEETMYGIADLDNCYCSRSAKLEQAPLCSRSIAAFREDLAQYWNFRETRLVTPTSSTIPIVQAAHDVLDRIFIQGYQYKKAGVIVMGISPDSPIQQDLFDLNAEQIQKMRRLDEVIDRINRMHGSETIVIGAQQYTQKNGKGKAEVFANAIKHDFRSKNPTTRWSDIIKLK